MDVRGGDCAVRQEVGEGRMTWPLPTTHRRVHPAAIGARARGIQQAVVGQGGSYAGRGSRWLGERAVDVGQDLSKAAQACSPFGGVGQPGEVFSEVFPRGWHLPLALTLAQRFRSNLEKAGNLVERQRCAVIAPRQRL